MNASCKVIMAGTFGVATIAMQFYGEWRLSIANVAFFKFIGNGLERLEACQRRGVLLAAL